MSTDRSFNPSQLLLHLDGYDYPAAYRWLRLQKFSGLIPWRCIDDVDEATAVRKEFLIEVGAGSIPVRDMLPFARREPTDDYAGFIQCDGEVTGQVCVAHLTFRGSAEVSDYPTHDVYESIWEWLAAVIEETREACMPQSVVDLEAKQRGGHAK